jgi:hypothetical protein
MGTDDPLDLVTRECEHTGHDTPRPPSPSASRLPRHPFIPAESSLQSAQVVEPGLDLDDEKRASPPVESEKVDPTM